MFREIGSFGPFFGKIRGSKIALFLLRGLNCYDGKHRGPKMHLSLKYKQNFVIYNNGSMNS